MSKILILDQKQKNKLFYEIIIYIDDKYFKRYPKVMFFTSLGRKRMTEDLHPLRPLFFE